MNSYYLDKQDKKRVFTNNHIVLTKDNFILYNIKHN